MSPANGLVTNLCPTERRRSIGKPPGFADGMDEIEQLAGRAAQAVLLGNDDDIAALERRHQLARLRAICPRAGGCLKPAVKS